MSVARRRRRGGVWGAATIGPLNKSRFRDSVNVTNQGEGVGTGRDLSLQVGIHHRRHSGVRPDWAEITREGCRGRIYAYMDAPSECKRFFGRVRRKAVRLSRTFGLFVAALRNGRGPVWRCAGRVRIGPASSMVRSSHITGCPDPVSMTVCPYSSCGLPTFLPALSAPAAQARGAGSL